MVADLNHVAKLATKLALRLTEIIASTTLSSTMTCIWIKTNTASIMIKTNRKLFTRIMIWVLALKYVEALISLSNLLISSIKISALCS